MKKIILISAIFIAVSGICFAEEGNEKIKPNSRAGGTLGIQIPDAEFNLGYGGSLFFHHTLSYSVFLSLNVGYNRYSHSLFLSEQKIAEAIVTEIPITFGINTFLTRNLFVGIEAGLFSQKGNSYDFIDANGQLRARFNLAKSTDFVVVPVVGVFIPLSNSISLIGNVKLQLAFDDGIESITGVNLGIAYSIP